MPEDNTYWQVAPEVHESYLWRLGNLALLSGLANISISNKTFDIKKPRYAASKIEHLDFALLINGVAVKLHGVNRHDTSKFRGWTQTEEELRKDLELMKELNINCVRTAHYPPHPKFIKMCDEMGFYVICENRRNG